MKRSFFQAAVTSILLYGCTAWTLTKQLEKKLDGNYTRMLRAILNKSWRQHPTRHQLYGHLPPITKTIQVRRTRHAGHCWRSRDELIRDVLLWTPTHGRAKAGRPARTYIQQLCEDTGCCPEELPRAMNDREEWRERVRDDDYYYWKYYYHYYFTPLRDQYTSVSRWFLTGVWVTLDGLHSSSYSQVFQSPYQYFGDCTKYHCHINIHKNIPLLHQLSDYYYYYYYSLPITIGISVTLMLPSFSILEQGPGTYISFRFLSILLSDQPAEKSLQFSKFCLLFFVVVIVDYHLVWSSSWD